MKNVSIREARQALSHLDRLLEAEGEVVLTKRGKAVARISRIGTTVAMPSHEELRAKMSPMGSGSEKLVREDRDGR